MKWVCENCSSVNEGNGRVCAVCDYRRSEKSVKESVKKERVEKREYFYRVKMPKIVNKILRIFFWIGSAIIFIVCAYLVIRLLKGDILALFQRIGELFGGAGKNAGAALGDNVFPLFKRLWENCVSATHSAADFVSLASNNAHTALIRFFYIIKDRIVENIADFIGMVAALFKK